MQPLRCWSCGKAIHREMAEFKTCLKAGIAPAAALDKVGLVRYCCRRFPITAVYPPLMLTIQVEKLTEESPRSPESN